MLRSLLLDCLLLFNSSTWKTVNKVRLAEIELINLLFVVFGLE